MDLALPIGDIRLPGTLVIPERALGFVMFAHGSGSSRFSPRNRHVAKLLQQRGLATLLFDLLTDEEEQIEAVETTLRFDVDMLAERLIAATDCVISQHYAQHLQLGYFGGSTGAAAALIAAARRPQYIKAVVSRGGRPDLVGSALKAVAAPTLFIVGGNDPWVLQTNQAAAARMVAPHRIDVIAGATHLFEEPGALDDVARLAGDWFTACFGARSRSSERFATSPHPSR